MLTRKDIQDTHLTTILRERGPLTAEALWSASQLDIDDFYDQLKDEEARGLLREKPGDASNAPLLDPIDEDDPGLLSFNIEGRAIPAAHITDAWEKERVEYSVIRYNLDFPPLMDKRKVLWSECWRRVQEYLKELAIYHADKNNVIARDRYKQALKRVRELMREDRELSAVARACVLSSGDRRVTGILQSV